MSSPSFTPPTAMSNSHFPAITEILIDILLNPPISDLVQATSVCKYWRRCIAHSKPLTETLFKHRPIPTPAGSNPHFEFLIPESVAAIVPRYIYKKQNLWSLVRSHEDEFIDYMTTGTTRQLVNYGDAFKMTQKYTFGNTLESAKFHETFYNIRAGFQGVRIAHGWPVGLRELHCDLCDKWHTGFRFENLHPLLRFLGGVTLCFRGHGSRLMLELALVSSNLATKSCFEQSCEEALAFAKHLRTLCRAVDAGGEGVATDSMAQPWVTKLVTQDERVVENNKGLTLKEVAPFLMTLLRAHLV
jgi:hypothetical protein